MIDLENFTADDMKALPKLAIKRIRAIARGNNCKQQDVKIIKAGGKMHHCIAYTNIDLEPTIDREVKKGRHQIGEYLENPATLEKILQDMAKDALKKDETRKYLANMVLSRPDKGFGLQNELLEVDQLKRTFCTHDPCQSCQGVGNTICAQCNGQRKEPCNKCRASGVVPCDYCNGVGMMNGTDGKQKQCNRCFGRRQTACPQCQVKLRTAFLYDKDAIPPSASIMIDKLGGKLTTKEHIHSVSESIKRDDKGLAIQHAITFPFGDMEFQVKDKPYRAQIIGFKAKMFKAPHFLSDLLIKPAAIMEQAAKNPRQASDLIDKLLGVRFYADCIYLSTQMAAKKAYIALMKKYPMGARPEFYKENIMNARKAIANASRSARWTAYAIGAAINVVLFGAYFMGPLRNMVLSSITLPNPMIISVGLFIVCAVLTVLVFNKTLMWLPL